MRRWRATILTTVVVLLWAVPGARAEDWPQIGGKNRDAVSAETGLLQEWPEGGPETLWTVELGRGFGAPVVYEGKVYVLDREPGKRDILRCFSLESGGELWSYSARAAGGVPHPGSRSQPLVTEKYVFAVGPRGDLYCWGRESHELLWRKNLLEEYGAPLPKYGVSQCPLSRGDTIIVIPYGSEAGVVALEKKTGREVWASGPFNPTEFAPYSSPVTATIGGVEQVVVNTYLEVAGLDPDTGRFLWKHEVTHCKRAIVSPVVLAEGRILRTGGYGAGTELLRVERKPDGGFVASTVWKSDACHCQIHQPVLYRDHLYIMGNGNTKHDGLMCLDPSGKVVWKTGRSPNFDRGGLLLADGRIFAVDATTAELVLIEPTPAGYRELGRGKYLERPQPWAPPVLSDGRLLIRDQRRMKCLDVRAR